MEGLFLVIVAVVFIGLLTWAAFVMMTKMGVDITLKWIFTVLALIGLLLITNRYVGLF